MNEPPGLRLRRFEDRDAPDLVRSANNRKIWLNLQDSFPHPYTAASAERWLGLRAADPEPAPHLAIEVDGGLVGVIGFEVGEDVHRLVGSIGYWIGEPYWGRGIATAALRAMTRHAFERFPLERLQASVYEWNPASARVCEKAGYTLEGTLRRSVVKDGRIGDVLLYAVVTDGRSDPRP